LLSANPGKRGLAREVLCRRRNGNHHFEQRSIQRRREASFCQYASGRSSFFSHSACKVVAAATRTAPQCHGLPRIDTTCAPASRATRDVALVDASATPIISYRLFARANPSCGGSIFSVAERPPRSWRQLKHFVERRAINDSTPKL